MWSIDHDFHLSLTNPPLMWNKCIHLFHLFIHPSQVSLPSFSGWKAKSLWHILGLPRGLLSVKHVRNTSPGRSILDRCSNHLSRLFLTRRSRSFTLRDLLNDWTPYITLKGGNVGSLTLLTALDCRWGEEYIMTKRWAALSLLKLCFYHYFLDITADAALIWCSALVLQTTSWLQIR